MLLILDNANDSAQVRQLLKWRAPTTMLIVTSRRSIAAPGLRTLDLSVMKPEEARALLRGVLDGRVVRDDELDGLAERCGRLPLALRVACTFLAQNSHVGMADYLRRLADERQRLRALRIEDDTELNVFAALAFSARQLRQEKLELEARWRLLAVFAASFDHLAAAAVWEVDADAAQSDLGALRLRSMVLYDESDGRWRLHDLMRDVAQVPLDGANTAALGGQLEAARARHARHYCTVLAAAEQLYVRGGDRVLAGLALYDLEQRNIAAGQAWAVAHLDETRRLHGSQPTMPGPAPMS